MQSVATSSFGGVVLKGRVCHLGRVCQRAPTQRLVLHPSEDKTSERHIQSLQHQAAPQGRHTHTHVQPRSPSAAKDKPRRCHAQATRRQPAPEGSRGHKGASHQRAAPRSQSVEFGGHGTSATNGALAKPSKPGATSAKVPSFGIPNIGYSFCLANRSSVWLQRPQRSRPVRNLTRRSSGPAPASPCQAA